MSGEPDFPVPPAFIGSANASWLRPTGDYQSWPNGDGTQQFVDSQGQPVVLLWQYGKVWECRDIEEETMSTQEELRAALNIMWQAHERVKKYAEARLLDLGNERASLRVELSIVENEIERMEVLKQQAWDATSQFNLVKTTLGLEET